MDRWSGILKVPLYSNKAYYRVALSLRLSPSSPTNLTTPSANAIFFNGDRVQGSGDPTVDRLSNIQTIAEILVSKFGTSINAYVIESSCYNGPFAVYKDFIPSSNNHGEPKSYDPVGFPASTSIVSILLSSLHQAVKVNGFVEPSSASSLPHTFLLGFSKGGTVLNQLVTELGNMEKPRTAVEGGGILMPNSRECFLNSISQIHYVDVGLNSSLAYLTDRETIGRISNRVIHQGGGGSGIRFVIHGTPRQWCDGRRKWIREEKDELVRLLKLEGQKTGGKLSVVERLYFADQLPSLKMHFEVIQHMDNLGWFELGMVSSRKEEGLRIEKEMGMFISLMGKGLPSNQMLNWVTGTLYQRFLDKDIKSFEDFHLAILDIFNTFNSALPGKHYDAPSRQLVEECFAKWKEARTGEEKKEIFVDFVRRNASLSKLDNTSMITGLVTPPAAMVVKRAGEKVPQLSAVKVIPDVLFVPSATVLALVFVKLSRRIFPKNAAAAAQLETT